LLNQALLAVVAVNCEGAEVRRVARCLWSSDWVLQASVDSEWWTASSRGRRRQRQPTSTDWANCSVPMCSPTPPQTPMVQPLHLIVRHGWG